MNRKTFLQFSIMVILVAACVPVTAVTPSTTPSTQAMTRGEIAPLLVSVYVGMTGETPTALECPFVDIADLPSDQREAVCQLWGLGVVVGTDRDVRYSPELPAGEWGDVMLKNLAEVVAAEGKGNP